MKDLECYKSIRERSLALCAPLMIEDFVVQPIKDVSPIKWHLAHTTWFFENFILAKFIKGYKAYDENFNILFNSYYKGVGDHWYQGSRGVLSRPSVDEVCKYRAVIDEQIVLLLENLFANTQGKAAKINHIALDENSAAKTIKNILEILAIGMHHEEQHQELILTDIKYILSVNPSKPAYGANIFEPQFCDEKSKYLEFDAGIYHIGFKEKLNSPNGDISFYESFAFDNEKPNHRVFLEPFAIQNRLVTNKEYLAFIEDGAYENFKFWLSDAWDLIEAQKISHPLYWQKIDNKWFYYTLSGFREIDLAAPVSHLSFYEADAFAKWSKKRLPTEFEWEVAANLNHRFSGLTNQLWQWTSSSYLPYPGYKCPDDIFAEYNSKFMNNQRVLRGGSVASPVNHIRLSYRNFFYPEKNWQFTGLRLAESL